MNCPIDGTELRMTDRQGIEIDYCPTCRGIWLDRGELDKIIERSTPPPEQELEQERYASERQQRHPDQRRKKRRRSLLEELLDFG